MRCGVRVRVPGDSVSRGFERAKRGREGIVGALVPVAMSRDSNEEERKASAAATKIQANFRGYRVRKQLKESEPVDGAVAAVGMKLPRNAAAEGSAGSGAERSDAERRQTREALEEKSATKIQAGVRGFLVRKRQQAARAAATRIQAGFRGFRTRKQLKENGQ